MSSFALLLAGVAWLVAGALLLPGLGIPAPLPIIIGVLGAVGLGVLAIRRRDPSHRSDPVSRMEARRRARARYEDERVRRLRRDRASSIERHDHEAQERVEARIRDLVEKRSRPSADPASNGAMWQDPGLGLAVPGNRTRSLDPLGAPDPLRPSDPPEPDDLLRPLDPADPTDPVDPAEPSDAPEPPDSVDAVLVAPVVVGQRRLAALAEAERDEAAERDEEARRRQDEIDAARVARARARDAERARAAAAEREAAELAAARAAAERENAAWEAVGPGPADDDERGWAVDDARPGWAAEPDAGRWEAVGPGASDDDRKAPDDRWADAPWGDAGTPAEGPSRDRRSGGRRGAP